MSTHAIAVENVKSGAVTTAVYEHPFVVRLCHWINTVALFVLVGSGLQIFRAFQVSGPRYRKKICSTGRKHSRSVAGWAVHCSGTLPSCGSISQPGSCTSAIRFLVATTNRFSLLGETYLECGQWFVTTSSLVRSRR